MSSTIELFDGPKWYLQTWWPSESWASRQESLLRMLAVSHRENLDVVPLINCLAAEHRGRYRRTLQLLAQRIHSGHSLVVALEQTPDALRDEEVLALRLASHSGTWSATFKQLLSYRQSDASVKGSPQQGTWFYWVWMCVIVFLVITLIIALIVPTFQKMAEEFGLGLPTAFKQLIYFSRGTVGWLLPLVVGLAIWFSFFRYPRRLFERKVAPRISRQAVQRQLVGVLRMLATTVEAGKPLAGALSTLARHHFDSSMRNQLLFARNEVEQGEKFWQSLAKVSLLSAAEAKALTEAPSPAVQAWTLRQLATQKLLVADRKTANVVSLIEPLITLFFGGMVLWVCFSLFAFLTQMISSLS